MNNWGRKKEENNLPRKQWAVFTPLKNAGKIPPDFGWKVNRWLQSPSQTVDKNSLFESESKLKSHQMELFSALGISTNMLCLKLHGDNPPIASAD